MERLTSDDLHSSASEKTVSSSYYSYTRPSLNGYANVDVVPSSSAATDETSDAESERVGVFDYVLSSSQHSNNNYSSFPATISAAAGEDVPGGSSFRQKWAQDMNSLVNDSRCDNGTELTTFSCGSDFRSRYTNDGSNSCGTDGAKTDTDNCSELEEVVVHSEMQSQRATYERYNPDFSYHGVCQSSSVHEPATVFMTSTTQSSNCAVDTSDKRDFIVRRSHQCTPPRKCEKSLFSTCYNVNLHVE